jgi:rRNA maturation endonuclease Nob1
VAGQASAVGPTDLSALFAAQRVLAIVLTDLRSARLPAVTDAAVDIAAKTVFAAIQEALAHEAGEGAVLTPQDRRNVWEGLEQAWAAIAEARGPQAAKRVQREAVGGRPLTVCFGQRARRINGRIHFATYGDGCGRVFVDDSPSRRRYCPSCQKKPGGRLKREAIARAQAGAEGRCRLVRWDAEGNRVEVWRLSCSSCGERFDTLEPRVRRCDRCRRGHRSPPRT